MLRKTRVALSVIVLTAVASPARAESITDTALWTAVEDPPHPNLSSSVDSNTQVTLTATGAVPAGADIGYQSVDGADVANSTMGYYFPANESFEVAVDYDVTALSSVGLGGIGFGVGEDRTGENSAGVGLAFNNGVATVFSGAARTNDATSAGLLSLGASLTGRFFVEYDHLTGTFVYGVNTTPGTAAPEETGSFAGRQNEWSDKGLLVSFFLRSDELQPIFDPLTSGTVHAAFSNFEVLSGTPVQAPAPGAAVLLAVLLLSASGARRGKA